MNAHPPALRHAHQTLVHGAGRLFSETLVLLAARLAIAGIFWRSGRTKVDGWFTLSDSAVALFAEEYQLPWVDPAVAASLAALAEHALPILLVLGLATRYAAIGLLAMTLVIQFLVYPDAWPTHLSWMSLMTLLVAKGAGILSFDALLSRRLFRSAQ
ncbi:DoxX family protein [Mitsuaria sp. WAJ17]|uniref:DoxX family protein n=1 Tax=Mitsuaria sp. WAJ17 TaxID=2761452 RepID=UPI0038578BFB